MRAALGSLWPRHSRPHPFPSPPPSFPPSQSTFWVQIVQVPAPCAIHKNKLEFKTRTMLYNTERQQSLWVFLVVKRMDRIEEGNLCRMANDGGMAAVDPLVSVTLSAVLKDALDQYAVLAGVAQPSKKNRCRTCPILSLSLVLSLSRPPLRPDLTSPCLCLCLCLASFPRSHTLPRGTQGGGLDDGEHCRRRDRAGDSGPTAARARVRLAHRGTGRLATSGRNRIRDEGE
jgi:hypothetical protein